jgi:hypothetical protein
VIGDGSEDRGASLSVHGYVSVELVAKSHVTPSLTAELLNVYYNSDLVWYETSLRTFDYIGHVWLVGDLDLGDPAYQHIQSYIRLWDSTGSGVYNTSDHWLDFEVCYPASPTPTPTAPVVLLTPTPAPTPAPTYGAELVAIQRDQLVLQIFGVASIGIFLLILVFKPR